MLALLVTPPVQVVLIGRPRVMASIADSSVTFASKAKQYGLTQAVLDSLSAAGITTYSGLLLLLLTPLVPLTMHD